MSTTFRRRTVEVEAMQTAPDDPLVAEKDREEQNRLVARWIVNEGGDVIVCGPSGLIISHLEEEMTVRPGDWIIRGPSGVFYPCRPDAFAEKFEAVA